MAGFTEKDGFSTSVDHKPNANRENHNNRDLNTIEREMKNKQKNGEPENVDLNHEIPASFAKNLDSISPEGEVFKADLLEDSAYDSLFGDAVEEYNAKQTRNDRKTSVQQYHQKIKKQSTTKAKHPQNAAYGMILQIGNVNVHPTRKQQQEILEESSRKIVERFPHLYFYNIAEHGDEYRVEPYSEEKIKKLEPDEYVVSDNGKSMKILNTIHIHQDYIPYRENCKRGLSRQNGLNQALTADGLKVAKGSGKTLEMAFQDECTAIIRETMREHGLQVLEEKSLREGHSRQHENDNVYKQKERIKALEQQEQELRPEVQNLRSEKKNLEKDVYNLKNQKSDLLAMNQDKEQLQEEIDRERSALAGWKAGKDEKLNDMEWALESLTQHTLERNTISVKTKDLKNCLDIPIPQGEKKMDVVVLPPDLVWQLSTERKRRYKQEHEDVKDIFEVADRELGGEVGKAVRNAFEGTESGKYRETVREEVREEIRQEFTETIHEKDKRISGKDEQLSSLQNAYEMQGQELHGVKQELQKWKKWARRLSEAIKGVFHREPKEVVAEHEKAVREQKERAQAEWEKSGNEQELKEYREELKNGQRKKKKPGFHDDGAR